MMNSLGINKAPKDTRVVVAMSGGVDSSVVAALLKEEGYDVVGITLQLYDFAAAAKKKGACCAGQDIHDARMVADAIGIPHYVLNYEDRFKNEVIEDFVNTYMQGETPIPCVKCNQSVKFRDLLATARDLKADVMATGHYIQRKMGQKAELHRAIDTGKDQSYFLFATTQPQLDFLRFPLGGMHKEDTRKHAERFGLQVKNKPDSQDICFVPTGGYAKVIERFRPGALEPGEIHHIDGRVVGTHDGIINFTVGQRRGLGVSDKDPLYVISIHPESGVVKVGPKEALAKPSTRIHSLNWLGDAPLEGEQRVIVKYRSMHSGVPARITAGDITGEAEVLFEEPQYGVSPGQACVFYEGDRVLGGGWIMR